MLSLAEYHREVMEAVCELGGLSVLEAQALLEEKRFDVEYGHKFRLSPTIIAGSILGINGCCIPIYPPKG